MSILYFRNAIAKKLRMMRTARRLVGSVSVPRQQQAAQISTTVPVPVGGSGRLVNNPFIVGNNLHLPVRFRKIKQQNPEYFQRSGEKRVTEHTNTVLDPDYLDSMVCTSITPSERM